MKFDEQLIIRNDIIDNETDWFWIKNDTGAWDGPKQDWETSHREKYYKYLKKADVVVTAGGNQGLYTRLYSNIFKAVYSFEPDALNFHALVRNNQKDNVIKMNCGLGAEAGFLSLNRPDMTNTGMHHFSGNGGIIPILPLDAFNFNRLDLLQLDVEGYEYNVITGAINTIRHCNPVIVLERARNSAVMQLMSDLEYKLIDDSVMDSVFIKI